MIEIQGVSKAYGQTAALHSIDLTIPAGQTTVFIGQSGCGKSTMLRLIIGLIQADSGSVFFEGTRITPEVVISLRLKMGYVIQEGGLFPHLTAYGNVVLMARYLGWSDERIKERLKDEPLGALDPMIRADLQVDLKRIFQALGKTVVLVTHDIAEAGFFGDIITLLRDGRVLQKGTLEELIQSPSDAFVTRFINAQRSPLDIIRKDSR